MHGLDNHLSEFRARVFSPVVTLSAFISQVLSEDKACRAAVARVLADRIDKGEKPCSSNTSGYCQARNRLPGKWILELTRSTGAKLHKEMSSEWLWKGRRVVLGDGSTVSMPDTEKNQEEYPQPKTSKKGVGFPLARLVVLISLATGAVLDVAIGSYQGKGSGEQTLLRKILGTLKPGEVFVADRYYCTYFLIATLQAMGVDVVFQNHSSRKTDFRKGKRLGKRDHIVEWEKSKRPDWMDCETYEAMPQSIRLRETKVDGKVLVSTFLDPKEVTKKDLGKLYKQRWYVETGLKYIKQILQMDILRSTTPEMVRKEIYVHLLTYNLIRTVIAKAGNLHGILPNEISFKGAIQFLNAFREKISLATGEKCVYLQEELLRAISNHKIGNRPGRSEPRAVKRRPKPFPRLTESRQEAKKTLGMQC